MISVPNETSVEVGKLGVKTFLPGIYTYTGSALGKGAVSLPNRLSRHLRSVKTNHWHIDYLLSIEDVYIEAVFVASSDTNLECKINQLVNAKMHGQVSILSFGASDCKNNCQSHLLFFPQSTSIRTFVKELVEKVYSNVRNKGIETLLQILPRSSNRCIHCECADAIKLL